MRTEYENLCKTVSETKTRTEYDNVCKMETETKYKTEYDQGLSVFSSIYFGFQFGNKKESAKLKAIFIAFSEDLKKISR